MMLAGDFSRVCWKKNREMDLSYLMLTMKDHLSYLKAQLRVLLEEIFVSSIDYLDFMEGEKP